MVEKRFAERKMFRSTSAFTKSARCFLAALAFIAVPALIGFKDGPADKSTMQALLTEAIENYDNLRSYRCKLKLHLTKADAVQKKEYLFYYKKPNLIRMHVEKGRHEGSTVVLREDGKIRGRREGILSFFAVTLDPRDERLYSLWDRHFTESDCGTVLKETKTKLMECDFFRLETVSEGTQLLLTAEDESGFIDQTWLEKENLILLKKRVRLPNGDKLLAIWSEVTLNPEFEKELFSF